MITLRLVSTTCSNLRFVSTQRLVKKKEDYYLNQSSFWFLPSFPNPSTPGRVCVPIDPEKADSFSPFTVPTLTLLVQELSSTAKSVEETSLGPYLVYFKKWLMGIELGIREQEREKRAEQDREKMLMF